MGISPTGKRRLFTAHTLCGLLRTAAFQPANARATVEYRPLPPDCLPEDVPGASGSQPTAHP
jgi:hypothetical protein